MRNLSGVRCTGTSIAALMIAVFTFVSVVPNVSADMRVKLKDGRILTLPVAPDQIDSVTFGSDSSVKGTLNQKQPVRRAADQVRADERSIQTSRDAERGSGAALTGVICADPEMLKICRLVEKVAPTNVTAMLLGESGTGKEVFARAVHELSPRADKPFAAINCAAIPENLLESELFGHEKGSFTGAVRQQKGKVELADSGTLFLDEVGDMPAAIQAKLLRFLQERTFERIGGRQSIAVDVRVICATNQKLEEMIAAGSFREDLYYRLSEMVINIPPLRDRIGDAEMLAQSFLQKFAEEQGKSIRGYTPEALASISVYDWPGNVRELENRVKRALIMAEGNRISPEDLDLQDVDGGAEILNLAKAREDAEKREIPRALSRADGNITQAAKLLGISRPTLYDLMRQHGFKVD
jgi:two-component system, NtrC family, response regulator